MEYRPWITYTNSSAQIPSLSHPPMCFPPWALLCPPHFRQLGPGDQDIARRQKAGLRIHQRQELRPNGTHRLAKRHISRETEGGVPSVVPSEARGSACAGGVNTNPPARPPDGAGRGRREGRRETLGASTHTPPIGIMFDRESLRRNNSPREPTQPPLHAGPRGVKP